MRTGAQDSRRPGQQPGLIHELVDEPRLARAGRADDGRQMGRLAVGGGLKGQFQPVQLLGPAHQPRHLSGDRARRVPLAHLALGQRAVDRANAGAAAARLLHRLEVELVLRLMKDRLRHQHAADRGQFLQPTSQSHRVADGRGAGAGRTFSGGSVARPGEVDRPAMEANAHLRAGPVVGPGRIGRIVVGAANAFVEEVEFALHDQRRMDGAHGVAAPRLGQPEQRQQAVAGVLLDLPAPIADDGVQHAPHGVDGVAYPFHVHTLRKRGEAG